VVLPRVPTGAEYRRLLPLPPSLELPPTVTVGIDRGGSGPLVPQVQGWGIAVVVLVDAAGATSMGWSWVAFPGQTAAVSPGGGGIPRA
jgi:hypothetical protein